MTTISKNIAQTLSVDEKQILAVIKLLNDGATVPFIARYRKEATGGLDDTQLRTLEERLIYLRELESRKKTILASIEKQEKLTPELASAIQDADDKTSLEDLYIPFKPKRRTKAQIAREAGLEPLAEALFDDHTLSPIEQAEGYVDKEKGIADTKAALDGAKQILMERFAEDATLIGQLRDYLTQQATLQACVIAGKEMAGTKFKDYFAYEEPLQNIPSHRALAILRGRKEGILQVKVLADDEACIKKIIAHFKLKATNSAADSWLAECANWAWRIKIFTHLELALINNLREQAEETAIYVFAKNLADLLMAAPAGMRVTLGLDPGFRTGVKTIVVDNTGKVLATTTIFPHAPQNQWDSAITTLASLCQTHAVELVSIGNGTASRETDKLVAELMKQHPALNLNKIMISEAGASVYSASALAAKEFPNLDVTLRGAASIARRLQDPLAELVKIDPKAIGVGQYQHDVSQTHLTRSLDSVVEDCVNAVGVNLNTASVPLLKHVSGLNQTAAENIVTYREKHGAFKNRTQLKQVPRLGDKRFEQAAGFLRIANGDNPLDASAVHPEAYPVAEKIIQTVGKPLGEFIGNHALLKSLKATDFVDEQFGLPTVTDIISELEKPGRDPRPEFKNALFKEGIDSIADLKVGMRLEGVVTNVADFGAFIDIGVHQDGLAHISELADRFISDPRSVVRTGDIVTVKILDIDQARKRINLTLKSATDTKSTKVEKAAHPKTKKYKSTKQKTAAKPSSPFGDKLMDALKKSKQ